MIDPRDPARLDDLDDTLSSLFGAERRHPGPPSGAQARVRAAVVASVAAAAVGSGAAAAMSTVITSGAAATSTSTTAASTTAAAVGSGFVAKLGGAGVVIAALAATTGGALFVSRYEPTSTSTTIAADVQAPTPPVGLVVADHVDPMITALPPTQASPRPPPTVEAVRHAPRVTAIDAPPPVAQTVPIDVPVDEPEHVAALAAERRQLGAARAALSAGNGRQALVLIDGHRATWPDGQLVEERDALLVLSLAHLGRRDDARAAATTFRARWPKSLFLDAIDRAVGR